MSVTLSTPEQDQRALKMLSLLTAVAVMYRNVAEARLVDDSERAGIAIADFLRAMEAEEGPGLGLIPEIQQFAEDIGFNMQQYQNGSPARPN